MPATFSVSQISTTPLGPVNIAWTARGVVALEIGGDLAAFASRIGERLGVAPIVEENSPLPNQVKEYLTGQRTTFNLEIDWALCTSFQRQVLEQQLAIPYGETRTYGQLAAQIGKPRASRAVGRAGATNPIAIIIPCHRVIGSDGSLRGYGAPGGTTTKAWLLTLEKETK